MEQQRNAIIKHWNWTISNVQTVRL